MGVGGIRYSTGTLFGTMSRGRDVFRPREYPKISQCASGDHHAGPVNERLNLRINPGIGQFDAFP